MPTPDEAIKLLQEGNLRFIEEDNVFPRFHLEHREDTAEKGQDPFVTVITCSDSRVTVEVIFDQGIGDIFVIRIPGNVCNVDEIGAIEYGTSHLHTPLCIILGHTYCGAVTDVVNNKEVHGCISELISNIQFAVEKTRKQNPDLEGIDFINAASINNIWQSIEDLLKRSESTRSLIRAGKLKVIGALYHVHSGHVDWLGEHPKQSRWI